MDVVKDKDGNAIPFDYDIPECLQSNPNLEVRSMSIYNRRPKLVFPKGFIFSGEKLIDYIINIACNQNPLMIIHDVSGNSPPEVHPLFQ